jgi:hypothetical protein
LNYLSTTLIFYIKADSGVFDPQLGKVVGDKGKGKVVEPSPDGTSADRPFPFETPVEQTKRVSSNNHYEIISIQVALT